MIHWSYNWYVNWKTPSLHSADEEEWVMSSKLFNCCPYGSGLQNWPWQSVCVWTFWCCFMAIIRNLQDVWTVTKSLEAIMMSCTTMTDLAEAFESWSGQWGAAPSIKILVRQSPSLLDLLHRPCMSIWLCNSPSCKSVSTIVLVHLISNLRKLRTTEKL